MKIKWNIDTGYVNKMPDWEFEIDDEDLEGLAGTEREVLIIERIQEEMDNQIHLIFTEHR